MKNRNTKFEEQNVLTEFVTPTVGGDSDTTIVLTNGELEMPRSSA